jgi:hypothetical protein
MLPPGAQALLQDRGQLRQDENDTERPHDEKAGAVGEGVNRKAKSGQMEMIGYGIGIMGLVLTILTGFLAWKKEVFKSDVKVVRVELEVLRVEMHEHKNSMEKGFDDFKEKINGDVEELRAISDKNDERNDHTMQRMLSLYEETHSQVMQQTGLCRQIQAGRTGMAEAEKVRQSAIHDWQMRIEDDIREIKKKLFV